MRSAFVLGSRLLVPAMLLLIFWSMPACSKNDGPDNKKDSTDTLPKKVVYDSAAYYVSFLINIYNTSGVFTDTFSDDASMKIYIVNGVVKIPGDSILNFPPIVFPSSGKDNIYKADWVPDNIGEINITGAQGIMTPGDTEAIVVLTHTGTVTPKWKLTALMGGTVTYGGGDAVPGWPPGFTFKTKLQSQDAFKLEQPGSYWDIWVYKDY
ncbi:MAG TPA: hypothetical protein VHE54_11960 [Puia sp.]|nr:hypothetical protein [Puia sp.]